MGLFTKREKIHFKRDEEGNVIAIEREQMPRGIKTIKQEKEPREIKELTREEQFPKEIQPEYVRKKRVERMERLGKGAMKWIDRNLQPVGGYPTKRKDRVAKKRKTTGFDYSPFGTPNKQKQTSGRKYVIVKGQAYPLAKTKKKKKKKTSRKGGFPSFDPMDNWGWLK